jgi:hypothetical protein
MAEFLQIDEEGIRVRLASKCNYAMLRRASLE